MWKSLVVVLALVGVPAAMAAEKVSPVEAAEAQVQVISINEADAQTLADTLVGIGIVKAEAIVAYREANGPFTSVNQLTDVKGIGEATLKKNLEKLRL